MTKKMCRKDCGREAVNKGICRPCDAKRNASYRAKDGIREKLNAQQRKRRENEPEIVRSVQNAYAKSPKGREIGRLKKRRRRARIRGNDYEKYTEQQIIEIYGTKCHICNKPIDFDASRRVGFDNWENGLHIDHLVPIALGGRDTLDNVRPSHAKCNIIKGAKDFKSSVEKSGGK